MELRKLSQMISDVVFKNEKDTFNDNVVLSKMGQLADDIASEIDGGIKKYGVIDDSYFAFEADGYGNKYFMDDANIPGLLSLSYIGYVDNDADVFVETRRRVLSGETNPYVGRASEALEHPQGGAWTFEHPVGGIA